MSSNTHTIPHTTWTKSLIVTQFQQTGRRWNSCFQTALIRRKWSAGSRLRERLACTVCCTARAVPAHRWLYVQSTSQDDGTERPDRFTRLYRGFGSMAAPYMSTRKMGVHINHRHLEPLGDPSAFPGLLKHDASPMAHSTDRISPAIGRISPAEMQSCPPLVAFLLFTSKNAPFVAMPGARSSVRSLLVRPGAPSSVWQISRGRCQVTIQT